MIVVVDQLKVLGCNAGTGVAGDAFGVHKKRPWGVIIVFKFRVCHPKTVNKMRQEFKLNYGRGPFKLAFLVLH